MPCLVHVVSHLAKFEVSVCTPDLLLVQIADAMLRLESAELNVTFFAAQTIHAKIRCNFRELPQERYAYVYIVVISPNQALGGQKVLCCQG